MYFLISPKSQLFSELSSHKLIHVQCILHNYISNRKSLNDLHWIQWIRTKSKSSMVTRDTLHLTTDTSPDVVVKKIFPFLILGSDIFTVMSHNGYLTRSSNGNAHSITANGNVSVANWVIPHATIQFLDFGIHLGKPLLEIFQWT